MASFHAFTLAVVVLVQTVCTLGYGGAPNPPTSRPAPPSPYGRNVPLPERPSPYKHSPPARPLPYHPSQTTPGPYGSGLPYVPPGGAHRQNPHQGAPSYSNGGHTQQPYGGAPAGRPQEVEKDELDEQFATIDRVSRQLDVAAEILASADSQESLEKKRLVQITTLHLPDVDIHDSLQDQQLDAIEQKLRVIVETIANLSATLDDVEAQNAENAEAIHDLDERLADVQLTDSAQVRKIAALLASARNLKPTLFTIAKNSFAVLANQILEVTAQINATSAIVNSRGCEVGVVTLSADDRRAVVSFNTDFGGVVPQIMYGITGVRNKFKSEPAPASAYPPKSYGQPRSPIHSSVGETGIYGDIFVAFATSEAIIIELIDPSFKEIHLKTVDVSWQACSVRPGTRLRSR